MALVKDPLGKLSDGVQRKTVASGSITVADLSATQTDDHVIFQVPAGAVVTGGVISVTEVFDAALEDINVDLVDLDGLNPIVVHAAADALTLGRTDAAGAAITGAALTAPHYLVVSVVVGGNTTGAVTVDLEYYVQGRTDENDG